MTRDAHGPTPAERDLDPDPVLRKVHSQPPGTRAKLNGVKMSKAILLLPRFKGAILDADVALRDPESRRPPLKVRAIAVFVNEAHGYETFLTSEPRKSGEDLQALVASYCDTHLGVPRRQRWWPFGHAKQNGEDTARNER